jgi:hypothetical protein
MSMACCGGGLDFASATTEAVGTVMENREPLPGVDANSIG